LREQADQPPGRNWNSVAPPQARRQPVRSGDLRRLPAHSTGGGRHRPGPL